MTDIPLRLTDRPDWLYLLREFDTLYRHGSSGGSKLIRSHRKRVRDALSRLMEANPEVHPRMAELKPVAAHLPRALDRGDRGAVAGMARALSRVAEELTWEWGYAKVPPALARKYAYCDPLRLMEIIPLGTCLSSTRGLPCDFGKNGKSWPSADRSARKGRSCHRSVFLAVNHAAR